MPTDLPVHFLEDITKKFSDHQLVGSGGYGQVYKVCEILISLFQVVSIMNSDNPLTAYPCSNTCILMK